MIKRFIAVSAVLVLMLSTVGCVSVNFSSSGRTGSVEGKGEMSTVSFPCGDFSRLTIRTEARLYYTAEKSDKVTIELQENLAQYITVSNDNGTLVIDSEKSFDISNNSMIPKIYVSAPVLERLRAEGVVDVQEADKIITDNFELDVSGVFNGTLNLEVKKLKADISGVGSATLNGIADSADIRADGVGDIRAFGLQTKEAYVKNGGVGSIEVSCSDQLTAEINGIGGVKYKGDPNTTVTVDGLGSFTKAD